MSTRANQQQINPPGPAPGASPPPARRRVEIITDFDRPRTIGGVLEMAESIIGGVFGVMLAVALIFFLIIIALRPASGNIHLPLWLSVPLAAGVLVLDGWFLAQVGSCISWREFPLGPALAARQRRFGGAIRILQAVWWALHFALFLFLSIGMHRRIAEAPDVGVRAETWSTIGLSFWVFAVTFTANLYLMLALGALTTNADLLHRVWRRRIILDIAITIAVFLAGRSAAGWPEMKIL